MRGDIDKQWKHYILNCLCDEIRNAPTAVRFYDNSLFFGTETIARFARKSRNHAGLRVIGSVGNGLEIPVSPS